MIYVFFSQHVTFTIEDYVIGIIDVPSNYVSWNSYNGVVNRDTLRKKHNEWTKFGVYYHAYKLLRRSFKTKWKN